MRSWNLAGGWFIPPHTGLSRSHPYITPCTRRVSRRPCSGTGPTVLMMKMILSFLTDPKQSPLSKSTQNTPTIRLVASVSPSPLCRVEQDHLTARVPLQVYLHTPHIRRKDDWSVTTAFTPTVALLVLMVNPHLNHLQSPIQLYQAILQLSRALHPATFHVLDCSPLILSTQHPLVHC